MIKRKHCILHPFTSRDIAQDSKELEYSSYVSSVLCHGKVQDNIKDEKFFKRLLYILIYPFTSHFKNRNKIKYINNVSSKYLRQIETLENDKCQHPDEIAACFGNLCSDLLSYDIDDTSKQRVASVIGFHIGKFIYLSDAICDYEKDKKQNKYNPFIYSLKNENEISNFFENDYKIILKREINEVRIAFDLLVGNDYNELIACANNILDLGMMSNLELALAKSRKGKNDGKSI